MRWGIGLYTGQVPADASRDVRDEYAFVVEQARLAEQLGIDSLWLSEHHGAEDGYLPSLIPMAAAILASTERLVVGTAVMLAPFHHPIRLAEDIAVLDQLSGGRFVLGIGTGWREREFRSFGLESRNRGRALEDTVAILRKAWTGERFDHQGGYYRFEDVLVRPRPFISGGPPIWLGGTGPKALVRAGSIADGHFGVGVPFGEAMRAWRTAVDARGEDVMRPFAFGQMRSGFIADDADRAFALASRGMRYTLRVHAGWAAEMAGRSTTDAQDATDTDLRAYNILGTAEEVADALRPYASEFAGRDDCHVSFRLHHPYTSREAVLAALESFGTKVVPALREHELGVIGSRTVC
ncbi:LLM class flavin-dependent oxidoreductase [Prauserella flavalba]|uniref:LLM class flavin-dependent oxidoreductase n=1 Tax=Prauserella flavalba TaxID=1477506 RepID=UPI0036E8DB3E